VRSLPRRMLYAALLRADTYEEVEADRSSIGQAIVVVLAACAAGGGARWIIGRDLPPELLTIQVIASLLEPLVLWVLGSAFAYMLGATFFRGPQTQTDFVEVLRTTGFAFSPALLRIFAWVPPPALGLLIDVAARLWVFVAVVVGIRQALDYTTPRAVGTFGFAALLVLLVMWGLALAPLPF
jgi:hypothetical protein